MPRALSWRIGLAFVVLAIATWIAIGGALFVVLRSLHADATYSTLTDVATPLVAQARGVLAANGDVRSVLGDLREQVQASGYAVSLVTANGQIVTLDGDPIPPDTVRIPSNAGRGATIQGTFRIADQQYEWVASVLRNAAGAGPRALILAAPDRSTADTFRDLLAALPAVVLVSILVGVPVAWLLSRSVTQPLRRLAAATADVPAHPAGTGSGGLPLEGPTEVRELTQRFNAMSEEIGRIRRQEADMLANLRHDLRTPVTVIAGFAGALNDGTATGEDVGRAAHAIGEEAARLEHSSASWALPGNSRRMVRGSGPSRSMPRRCSRRQRSGSAPRPPQTASSSASWNRDRRPRGIRLRRGRRRRPGSCSRPTEGPSSGSWPT